MHLPLNSRISVSGQIDPSDLRELKAQGFNVIVDARPDGEVPPTHQSDVMKTAAETEDLSFFYIPMTPGTLPSERAAADFITATTEGRVFAYCGGGPRAVVLASFAAAAESHHLDTILSEARAAGIDLSPARDELIARGAKEA